MKQAMIASAPGVEGFGPNCLGGAVHIEHGYHHATSIPRPVVEAGDGTAWAEFECRLAKQGGQG